MNGGTLDPENALLELTAIVADYYGMPLFQYVDHLRQVRERHGESAAWLDLMTAIQTKEAKAEKQNRENERRNNG